MVTPNESRLQGREGGSRNMNWRTAAFSVQRRADRQHPRRDRAAGRDVPRQRRLRHRGRHLGADRHDAPVARRGLAGHARPPADHAVHRRRGQHHLRHPDADHRRCHVGADQGHAVQYPGRRAALVGPQDRAQFLPASCSARRSTTPRRAGTSSPRNVALFFLVTAIVNEAVRLGFDGRARSCPQPACSPASTSGSCSRSSSSCR